VTLQLHKLMWQISSDSVTSEDVVIHLRKVGIYGEKNCSM